MQISTTSLSDLKNAARAIIDFAGTGRLFLLYGDMGAGKTTLIKSVCAELGVSDAVTSPTFSIVNEYKGTAGPLYHFDFYRIKTPNEALDMGYEEYLYSGNYCLVEWPEKIDRLIPAHYIRIRITITNTTSRQITVENI